MDLSSYSLMDGSHALSSAQPLLSEMQGGYNTHNFQIEAGTFAIEVRRDI